MTKESNYKCLCNLHVRKGASVIAIIEIILAVLAIVYHAFFNVGFSWWFWLFYEITQIIVCLLVISADRSDHAWLYLPYLIIAALDLIGFGIYAFFCIYCVIRLPGHIRDDFDNAKDARDYYNNAFIGTIIGSLVSAYFWTVVFRAFKYMRNGFEGRCENKDEGPIDIGEDANSSSYVKEKLTIIIKRVIYISIAFTALLVLTLLIRFSVSRYFIEESSFRLTDIQYFIIFVIIGTTCLKTIAILTIFPLLFALWLVWYIKKDVIYGRHIGDALKKFLQFNLTMYIVVEIVMLIGAVFIQDTPLGREDQIYWIFLIDIVVSIALATDTSAEYRDIRKTKSIFSKILAKNIIGHAIYQISVVLSILFLAQKFIPDVDNGLWAPLHSPPSKHFTIIFNTFCLMTLFNAINYRKIQSEHNVFKGLFKNPIFCVIITIMLILQILIVQYSDEFLVYDKEIYDEEKRHYVGYGYHGWFFITPLDLTQWGICFAFGLGELLWGQIITAIPPRQ